jgi:crotonobetainyl-CoA:carnitine CoA-transferase CaiB-like acyl-CoA transferase
VHQLATAYVGDAARTAGAPVADDTATHIVCPCDGDDEWCVVSVRSDIDRETLAALTGGLEVSAWTWKRDKTAVARQLQEAGVAAAPMNRAIDVLTDPQVLFRNLYTDMVHPLFDAPMPSETGPAPYTDIPRAEFRPAPMPGEHTREICQKVLAMATDDVDRLIAEGVLFQGRQ